MIKIENSNKKDEQNNILDNKLYQKKVNEYFYEKREELNFYEKLYSKIINKNELINELEFDPEKRIKSMIEFSLSRQRITKEVLFNIFNCFISRVIGYITYNSEKLYLVEAKLMKNKKNYIEYILVNEKVLSIKMNQKNFSCKCLDNCLNEKYILP